MLLDPTSRSYFAKATKESATKHKFQISDWMAGEFVLRMEKNRNNLGDFP